MNLQKQIKEEYAHITKAEIRELICPKQDFQVDKILEKCEEFLSSKFVPKTFDEVKKNYEFSYKLIKKIDFTSNDITLFSLSLHDLQDFRGKVVYSKNPFPSYPDQEDQFSSNVGIFISSLINRHHKKTKERAQITEQYHINTSLYEKKIDWLCFRNDGANVFIKGDTGYFTCFSMKDGRVNVNGTAENAAGKYMEGGILILKEAKNSLGDHMTGGRIEVEKTGDYTGNCMRNGEIFISNEIEGIGTYYFGKIYFKNEKMPYRARISPCIRLSMEDEEHFLKNYVEK